MNKVLVVSPHLDDAVFSAGQFISGWKDVDVITVFSGLPSDPDVSTPYDLKCGFSTARDAIAVRRAEDTSAIGLLGANAIHWNFPDSQYGEMTGMLTLATTLMQRIEEYDYEFIVGPLGLGHADHVVVSDTLLTIKHNADIKQELYLWEDVPLRVVDPIEVTTRLDEIESNVFLDSPGTGSMADKIRSTMCYRSQVGTGILDPYVLFVPERFWKIV